MYIAINCQSSNIFLNKKTDRYLTKHFKPVARHAHYDILLS
jgi:hypothetical protein